MIQDAKRFKTNQIFTTGFSWWKTSATFARSLLKC